MKKVFALGLVLMLALVPLVGSVKAAPYSKPSSSGSGVVGAALAWYYLYLHQNKTFSELYNQSLKRGIDNETLSFAQALAQNASKEFKTALTFGTPEKPSRVRWLPFMMHIRRAYLDLLKATYVLEKALK